MPLKNTPCPRCGRLKRAEAASCILCRREDLAEAARRSTTCQECGGPKARRRNTKTCWDCHVAAKPKLERVCSCGQPKHANAQMCAACRNAMRDEARKNRRVCACGAEMYRTSTQCMDCYRASVAPKPKPEPEDAGAGSQRMVHVDDVEWLMECDPYATSANLAGRFNVARESLHRALKRAGRQDLLDRLARNAELAGHSVTRRSA